MNRRIKRVCVIGAGLAGLACAVAAAGTGMDVQVFDDAGQEPGWSGHVEVVPSMLRDLVALGVGDACVRAGFPYHGVDVIDRHGRLLHQLPTENLAGSRYPAALGIERSALHDILEQAATRGGASMQKGAQVVSIQTLDGTAKLMLANGAQRQADLVVLASGATSMLRTQLFPPAHLSADFAQIWWCALIQRPVDLDRPVLALGRAGQRMAIVPVRNDAAAIALTLPTPPRPTPAPHVLLRESMHAFASRVRSLARYISAQTPVAVLPVRCELLGEPWHHGAVLAVGDCAHLLPPDLGHAAAQAVEDARVLGELLQEAPDRVSLLEDFQKRRVQRVQRVHALSLRASQLDFASEAEAEAELPQLMEQLSRVVAQPA